MQYVKRLVAGRQKAVVAFVVAAVGAFLAKHGLTVHGTFVSYVQAAVVGFLAHFGVYFTKNK